MLHVTVTDVDPAKIQDMAEMQAHWTWRRPFEVNGDWYMGFWHNDDDHESRRYTFKPSMMATLRPNQQHFSLRGPYIGKCTRYSLPSLSGTHMVSAGSGSALDRDIYTKYIYTLWFGRWMAPAHRTGPKMKSQVFVQARYFPSHDSAAGNRWHRPPPFPDAGAGD